MQVVPAVAELLHRPGSKVLDEHVGVEQQRLELLAVGRVLEIERSRLLPAVERGEVRGDAVDERADVPAVVAASGCSILMTSAPRSDSTMVQ